MFSNVVDSLEVYIGDLICKLSDDPVSPATPKEKDKEKDKENNLVESTRLFHHLENYRNNLDRSIKVINELSKLV